jgi:hypothetical protein
MQLLESDHLLLVVDDGKEMIVYLDRAMAISQALMRTPKKKWNFPWIAGKVVIAYDEIKRLLIVVSAFSSQVR